ncbi:DHA2 family metal-tetracycline-proton antiporter-like MFS transporter [Salirhabdus euzebyi]|uniref:DHA2 family metal-tetracycline-proton antiporter-like MFS transporter n=1 Tax=Salirhabdus euzebyi TaxID=394506 RepID=A0A841Q931_9BACI|nr:MFS transporter [Salirhabdus euzebyi]MBB6454823.1 DHA2 family metal-tetracycline-proton antiporter-like MFS transporter [Salirhabdus euzebyi]
MKNTTTSLDETDEVKIKNPKALLTALCFVLMMSVMNGTMFNIAIPDIAKTFQLMPSEVSWVMTGYIMVYAVGALMYGKLADYYPFKTLITIGLTIFAIGSLFGFFAQSYLMVLIARVIQASGGAMLPALVFLAPIRYFPKERGKVLGIISSVMAFASGVGPIVGGFIAGFLDWKFLFLTSACIIIMLPFLRKNLPDEKKREAHVDFIGAFFVAGTIATLLIGITMESLISIGGMLFFLTCFFVRSKYVEYPFIPPHFFKNKKFVATIITSFFGVACLFGLMFTLPIMLRDVHELTTMQIGLVLFPGAICAAIIGQFGGRLVDSKGSRFVLFLSMMILSTGFFVISISTGLHPIVLSLSIILAYMCFPLVQASTADLLANILPNKETGVGMGVFNLMNFVAGSLSGAIIGKVLDIYSPEKSFNPFAQKGGSAAYSDVFLMFVFIVLGAYLFFRTFYENKKRSLEA